ncbi:CLUMA_CG010963, isoform A [Clunio marinus]|uniref:CLUMA_CG010963, isoform A n=1 Tax=Clunio marinus TaxID=568069 RepID=A0A1J1IGK4_9DIPT|nr:CLUMA_CG010963, isoform A [Clunio marinus]
MKMDPKMEPVHNFTAELFSLYDYKIPISKAKMGSITKTAMKAIKFYKHVVQNVEKFILKCKPEYKIPGLYVIDSIVRQSRHQFGPEKDVFAPRFARNMEETFAHLFRCSQEDKSKIIRVLNLWQKNNVFAPEVIQPLFDLANPDHPVHQAYIQQQQQNQSGDVSNGMNIQRESPHQSQKEEQSGSETLNALNIQKFQYQQMMMQQQQQSTMDQIAGIDSIKFNNQLLEYDYGSEGDDDKGDAGQTVTHQHQMQMPVLPYPFNSFSKCLEDPNILKQLQNIKQIDMQRYLNDIPGASNSMMDQQQSQNSGLTLANINNLRGPPPINDSKDQDVELVGELLPAEIIIPVSSRSPTPNRHKRRKTRSRSRDKNRYGRRRRSRSKSRSYSRSPRNKRRSSRDRVKDKEREIEKERRRKGLPDIKKEHLSVCSTTLWVGHLSKLVQQEELSDTFGKYGDIVSIDMIPPRGCAYIVMNRRQDAYKAMQALKNHKMQNRAITISWAAGKGVKSKEWKDYFDQTLGVTYIPNNKLTHSTDFESIEEGGMYDEDTMPAWVKEKLKQPQIQPTVNKDGMMIPQFFAQSIDTSQPPPNSSLLPTMPPFPLGARPLLIPGSGLMPLGVPPPNMLVPGMVFPTGQPPGILGFPLAAGAPSGNSSAQQIIAPPTGHEQPSGDDHMDIEMEDENHSVTKNDGSQMSIQQAFFNQPPPMNLAALMMGVNQSAALQNAQPTTNDQQNDGQEYNMMGNRNNRSLSRERDRQDFRSRGHRDRSDRRSGPGGDFNNRNSRWPNDSNGRDRSRPRDGLSQNNYNRRLGNQQEIPSLLSQPMPLLDEGINPRQRNNDFGRDDFDRRGGFNRGGFQSMRGRARGQFNRGAGGRGFNNNNFNDRQGGFHDRDMNQNQRGRGGNRNWRDDDMDNRRNFSQRGSFDRKGSRWVGNQRNDEWDQRDDREWDDGDDDEDQNNQQKQESIENQEETEARNDDNVENNYQQLNENNEEMPPGTEAHENEFVSENTRQLDNFQQEDNEESFNNPVHSETKNVDDDGDDENPGNTTPLCDETEAKDNA